MAVRLKPISIPLNGYTLLRVPTGISAKGLKLTLFPYMYGPAGNSVCADNLPKKLSKRNGPSRCETPGTQYGSVRLIRSIQKGSALLLIAIEPLLLGPQSRVCLPTETSCPNRRTVTYVSNSRNWLVVGKGVPGCTGS